MASPTATPPAHFLRIAASSSVNSIVKVLTGLTHGVIFDVIFMLFNVKVVVNLVTGVVFDVIFMLPNSISYLIKSKSLNTGPGNFGTSESIE